MKPLNRIFVDDCSPESGTKMIVWEDNEGDLNFQIVSFHGRSQNVRICASGGGSRYEGLNRELKELLKKY